MACILGVFWSVVWPGLGHFAIHRKRRRLMNWLVIANLAATFLVFVIAGPVRDRNDLAAVISDRSDFMALAVSLMIMAITRFGTAADVAWRSRPTGKAFTTIVAAFASTTMVFVAVAPLTVAADYVWQTDRMLERVFASSDAITANPAPLSAATSGGTDDDTTVTTVAAVTSGPFAGQARVNILLIGGDAGPGRPSMRTDTMIVVSIDPGTGDTAIISIPRNMIMMPFAAGTPLADEFPDGFPFLANALYHYVDGNRELAGGGNDAGAQALKQSMAQLLGIPINYYVLVDMLGFVDIIDAIGGIDIYVTKRVTTPLNPEHGMEDVPEYIEPGQQHMDGTLALSYARSRYVDSDYGRMGRQRCVIAAIANSAQPMSVALGLGQLVSAFGDAVRTDIPRNKLGDFAKLIERFTANGGVEEARSLHLGPPNINNGSWDAQHVRNLVAGTLIPGLDPENSQPKSLLDGCTPPE
ncbi:MAG: LCP family protein [Actinomycetota bacterium]|nr:LCP family protein [Actinomycetota bacterium]